MRIGIVKKKYLFVLLHPIDFSGHLWPLANDLSNGKSHHLKAVVVNRRSFAGRFRPL